MSDSISDRPDFRIEIHQNKYLAAGETQVHAIVMVEAEGGPEAMTARPTGAAEVIIVDTSGSMTGERLVAAKRAAKAAVDALRDGVDFAIISGSDRASMVYPRDMLMAPATDRNRAQAKSAIARLTASGGTRMGRWVELASTLFADRQSGIRHAILLTDGKNEHESAERLDAALAACSGRFVCDCRGVGTDWEVSTLRRVADALLGDVDLVADPRDLAADFRAMIESAMGKAVADVALRIWTPNGATPRFVKQVLPSVQDLTDRRTEIGVPGVRPGQGPTTGDYPTGIWGKERRDYHVCVTVPAGRPYEEILAARVSLVLPAPGDAPDEVLTEGNVLAEWTDDEMPSTGLHPWVEHYSEQERLADSIRVGLGAYKQGDLEAASRALGRAVNLAKETGNKETSVRLDGVVDVDPATGVTHVKRGVEKVAEMQLDVKSTGAVPPPEPATPRPPREDED
ncbi:MAG TPA: VWA domain-containing protein [Streptosporangiaceae bacterium]|nr:VWA domain-containing protein [Streptosporangiaceae bacterium]